MSHQDSPRAQGDLFVPTGARQPAPPHAQSGDVHLERGAPRTDKSDGSAAIDTSVTSGSEEGGLSQRTPAPTGLATHPLLAVLDVLRDRGVEVRGVGDRLQVRPRDAVSDGEVGVLRKFRSLALALVQPEQGTPGGDTSDGRDREQLLSLLAAFPHAASIDEAFAAEQLAAIEPEEADGGGCGACGGKRFWRPSPDHAWLCGNCNPGSGPDLVEWRTT